MSQNATSNSLANPEKVVKDMQRYDMKLHYDRKVHFFSLLVADNDELEVRP